jgi:hypothetical protein
LTWELIREVTRCTGHCCRSFSFGLSPVEIGQKVIEERVDPATTRWFTEALVYLGEGTEPPSGFRNSVGKPWVYGYEPSNHGRQFWYSCRWLGDERCLRYEDRPRVCREYPYEGNDCFNPGCTRRTIMAEGLTWHGEDEWVEEIMGRVGKLLDEVQP